MAAPEQAVAQTLTASYAKKDLEAIGVELSPDEFRKLSKEKKLQKIEYALFPKNRLDAINWNFLAEPNGTKKKAAAYRIVNQILKEKSSVDYVKSYDESKLAASQQQHDPSKTVKLLLDHDKCFGIDEKDSEVQTTRVKEFIRALVTRIREQGYKHIKLKIGSNRRGYWGDLLNSQKYNNGSCFTRLVEVNDLFKKELVLQDLADVSVELDGSLETDYKTGRKQLDFTFKTCLKIKQGDFNTAEEYFEAISNLVDSPNYPICVTKHELIYREANLNPEDVWFVDDIYYTTVHDFAEAPDFLPQNLKVVSFKFDITEQVTTEEYEKRTKIYTREERKQMNNTLNDWEKMSVSNTSLALCVTGTGEHDTNCYENAGLLSEYTRHILAENSFVNCIKHRKTSSLPLFSAASSAETLEYKEVQQNADLELIGIDEEGFADLATREEKLKALHHRLFPLGDYKSPGIDAPFLRDPAKKSAAERLVNHLLKQPKTQNYLERYKEALAEQNNNLDPSETVTLLLDHDGCFYKGAANEQNVNDFIKALIQEVRLRGFKHINLKIGSNRRNLYFDRLNELTHPDSGSCYTRLVDIHSKFKDELKAQELDISVAINGDMIIDREAQQAPGTHFATALQIADGAFDTASGYFNAIIKTYNSIPKVLATEQPTVAEKSSVDEDYDSSDDSSDDEGVDSENGVGQSSEKKLEAEAEAVEEAIPQNKGALNSIKFIKASPRTYHREKTDLILEEANKAPGGNVYFIDDHDSGILTPIKETLSPNMLPGELRLIHFNSRMPASQAKVVATIVGTGSVVANCDEIAPKIPAYPIRSERDPNSKALSYPEQMKQFWSKLAEFKKKHFSGKKANPVNKRITDLANKIIWQDVVLAQVSSEADHLIEDHWLRSVAGKKPAFIKKGDDIYIYRFNGSNWDKPILRKSSDLAELQFPNRDQVPTTINASNLPEELHQKLGGSVRSGIIGEREKALYSQQPELIKETTEKLIAVLEKHTFNDQRQILSTMAKMVIQNDPKLGYRPSKLTSNFFSNDELGINRNIDIKAIKETYLYFLEKGLNQKNISRSEKVAILSEAQQEELVNYNREWKFITTTTRLRVNELHERHSNWLKEEILQKEPADRDEKALDDLDECSVQISNQFRA